jgi:hypothetical protein
MTPRFIIRDYHADDFEAIKALHDATEIDYKMPDLNSSLFLVTKVMEFDGVIRLAVGAYIQCELYLWIDKTDWATPEEKFSAIKQIEKNLIRELWLKGVDEAVLYLPPGMGAFGRRLEQLGFAKGRDGWLHYNKRTGEKE